MILHIVNSTYGRASNIAFRTAKIAEALRVAKVPYAVLCRKSDFVESNVHAVLPFGDLFPRLINGLRIYFVPGLPSRKIDNRVFSYFIRRALHRVNLGTVRIAHIWEPIPELFDIFRAQNIPTILEVPIAPAFYGRRLVDRGLQTGGKIDSDVEAAERASFRKADRLLVPSTFVRNLLVEDGVDPAKITVRGFGSDASSDSVDYSPCGKVRFAFAGTFNSRKGANVLLDAWDEELAEDELHLCGHVFPEYRSRIQAPRYRNIVTPGFVKTREYLKDCHVYVLPTLMEGSAKSVYEAMSLGMPIITTEAAGSIVEDGKEGFIVEIGNSSQLREKMLWFKRHPEAIRTMGEAARRKVAEYPWSRYGEGVLNVYRELDAGTHSR